MKQYSIIIALSICGSLSAMEHAMEQQLIKIPSPQKLRKAFRKEGYTTWAMNTDFPNTFGNKIVSERGLEDYLKISLREHNNTYSEEQLTAMSRKYMNIIYNALMTDRIANL